MTRRMLLQSGAMAALAGVRAGGAETAEGSPLIRPAAATPATASAMAGLPKVGRLAPRASKTIAASPISIGFETLDRQSYDPARCYELAGQTGVKWARVQTGWARCEKTKGVFDFSWLDQIVDRLRAEGLQPWFNLGYGNRLYTTQANSEFAVGWIPMYSEPERAAWVRFVQKIAEHFRDRVTHWELWNEPNIPNFWQPTQPTGADYVKFVELTAPEIRSRVRSSFLIGGGLAGVPFGYLDDCLRAGLARHVDAISFHPYRHTPEANYASQVRALRALTRKHKQSLQLWQGENGAPSSADGSGALSQLAWTEPAQAKWLPRRLITDLAYGIDVTSYFLIVDLVNYVALKASGKTNFKGVLRGTDYTPKPSYAALQHVCRLFDADTKPEDFSVELGDRATGLMSATFARTGRPLCAYWNPAPLPEGAESGTVTLRLWSEAASALERPVVVDIVSGAIHEAPAPKRDGSHRDGTLTFAQLPLADAPMILTDRSVIE